MEKIKRLFTNEESRTLLFLIVSAIAVIISFLKIGNFPIDPAWISIILCGLPIIKEAVTGMVTEFDIKADVLVSLALIASVIIGEVFAAGEVAVIMALGSMLEERTVAKARAGIEKLVDLTPQTARVLRDKGEEIIEAKNVLIKDKIRVLAGETIPVDGIIIEGDTSIDQSVMTGESLPVDKSAGDEIFSGTVNQFGTFTMEAGKVGEDSSLQRMIRLVESADADKAKIVGIADRFATWIVVIALLSAAGTWFVTGEIIRAVTILVVFCPCALVLATPTAIMAGIGNASKYGILVKEGDALERLAAVDYIGFDKTGTLTYGKPEVVEIHSCRSGWSEEKLLRVTAAAEFNSEHPLGKAVVACYRGRYKETLQKPENFRLLLGKGIEAKIGTDKILAGNRQLLEEHGVVLSDEVTEQIKKHLDGGATIIYAAAGKELVGYLVLADILREDAKDTVAGIHKKGVKSVLMTGDNQQTADHIGTLAGIRQIYADCLPEDKMNHIKELQQSGSYLCMLGDGINDAPALKTSHVGIAMGGIGSDIAIDAADIALIRDDIKELPHLLGIAKKTMRTIKANMTFSILLNFAAIILAMTGILTPVVGALVHNAGSVFVVINSSLLLNWRERLLEV